MNIHAGLIALAIAAFGLVAVADEVAGGNIEASVLEVQADRFRAMTEVDIAALDAILADDLVYTHTTGRSETKGEFLASIQGMVKYRSIAPKESQVRIYGDIAVVNGESAMHVSAGERQIFMDILFIEVYHRNDGDWQLVSWQSTRIPKE